jgi:hypothetical protein
VNKGVKIPQGDKVNPLWQRLPKMGCFGLMSLNPLLLEISG